MNRGKDRQSPERRGGRVVECGGLENRCPFARTGGSNPSLSARIKDLATPPDEPPRLEILEVPGLQTFDSGECLNVPIRLKRSSAVNRLYRGLTNVDVFQTGGHRL